MILKDNEQAHAQAAAIVKRGGVIAFRTDTFYGLGADPLNRSAVGAIRKLKGREETKPILVLLADRKDVDRFIANRSKLFDRVSEHCWPGPLTIVGPAGDDLPEELTAGTGTIGMRWPDDANVRELVRVCGGALTATSANPSGQPAAHSAQQVEDYFALRVDLIIDNGTVSATEPSTVVDLTGRQPRIIREGAITSEQLAAVLQTGLL